MRILDIYIEHNLLKIKCNNSLFSSYSYDELVDYDKRFKGFHSIKDIYLFLLSFIEKEEIQVINNSLILKGWNITIPLKHHSIIYNFINQLEFLFSQLVHSNLKVLHTIKGKGSICSMCLLKDGRLVSGGENGIVIYDRLTYQPHIFIEYEDYGIFSVCGLRNGNLASSTDRVIDIYEISEIGYYYVCTLKGHTSIVNKVIEMKDGRLSSCSLDKTIMIWDRNYQHIKTLEGNTDRINSIIEMNNYIISASKDKTVRVWNKHTYEFIQVIKGIYCSDENSSSKKKEDTIIFGGDGILFTLNISNFQHRSYKHHRLGNILSILVFREDQALLGNKQGEIICYDLLFEQIIFIQKINEEGISCLIKSENDSGIFSSSYDGNINYLSII